jgi:hypothetical protein
MYYKDQKCPSLKSPNSARGRKIPKKWSALEIQVLSELLAKLGPAKKKLFHERSQKPTNYKPLLKYN